MMSSMGETTYYGSDEFGVAECRQHGADLSDHGTGEVPTVIPDATSHNWGWLGLQARSRGG